MPWPLISMTRLVWTFIRVRDAGSSDSDTEHFLCFCGSWMFSVWCIETLTPMFLPLSSSRGEFFSGRDFTWPPARSFRDTFTLPINLKQHNHNQSLVWLISMICLIYSTQHVSVQHQLKYATVTMTCVTSQYSVCCWSYCRNTHRNNTRLINNTLDQTTLLLFHQTHELRTFIWNILQESITPPNVHHRQQYTHTHTDTQTRTDTLTHTRT